jgi:hypothetical protein
MKKPTLFFVLIALLSNSAFAATYKLDFVLEMINTAPFKGTVVTHEGQPASISSNNVSVQLIPTKQSNGAVMIKAEIWGKAKLKGSSRKHVGNATIITKLNQYAKISKFKDNGMPTYRLTITPSEQ